MNIKEKDYEQLVLHGLKHEDIEKEKAAERKALTRKYGLKPEDAKYTQEATGQTRDIVAEKLGISGRQWERMKYIYRHKDLYEEQEYQDWKVGKLSTSKLYNKLNREIKAIEDFDRIIDKIDTMQMHTFRFVYFDGFKRLESMEADLESALYKYPDSLKKIVNKTLSYSKDLAIRFAGEQNNELLDLKLEISELKKKIERNLQNNK